MLCYAILFNNINIHSKLFLGNTNENEVKTRHYNENYSLHKLRKLTIHFALNKSAIIFIQNFRFLIKLVYSKIILYFNILNLYILSYIMIVFNTDNNK